MLHRNNTPAAMPPELQEMAYQAWFRTPEQQMDEEELMQIEWLRSIHPSQRAWAEAMIAQDRWSKSKPCKDSNPFD